MYAGIRSFERGGFLVNIFFAAGTDTVRQATNTLRYPDSLGPFIDCGGNAISSYCSFA